MVLSSRTLGAPESEDLLADAPHIWKGKRKAQESVIAEVFTDEEVDDGLDWDRT